MGNLNLMADKPLLMEDRHLPMEDKPHMMAKEEL